MHMQVNQSDASRPGRRVGPALSKTACPCVHSCSRPHITLHLPPAVRPAWRARSVMNMHALTALLHTDPTGRPQLLAGLSSDDATTLVEHLKTEADRHWYINANTSLAMANLIVEIGRVRGDTWQT